MENSGGQSQFTFFVTIDTRQVTFAYLERYLVVHSHTFLVLRKYPKEVGILPHIAAR